MRTDLVNERGKTDLDWRQCAVGGRFSDFVAPCIARHLAPFVQHRMIQVFRFPVCFAGQADAVKGGTRTSRSIQ